MQCNVCAGHAWTEQFRTMSGCIQACGSQRQLWLFNWQGRQQHSWASRGQTAVACHFSL